MWDDEFPCLQDVNNKVCLDRRRTYPPGQLNLSILPNAQLEYCQVEYLEKYSKF